MAPRLPHVEGFEVEAHAGSGATGHVYRARARATGEAVALKLLRDAGGLDAERFAREAEILAGLSHPHVVRYVAHGFAEGAPYLAMEWLEGPTLEQRLAGPALGLRDVAALGRRLADALAAVHALDVVHRDVKPSNILLAGGEASHVKIVDFGIARQRGRNRLTLTGVTVGTPRYMAPEQARGLADIGSAADVFALGAVLFQCVARRPPFEGGIREVLVQIVMAEAPALADVVPGVPEELDRLVAAMLEKRPEDRPTAAEVAARLGALERRAPPKVPSARVGGRGLTATEQALRCFALARATLPSEAELDRLRDVVARTSSRLDVLADGSLLACPEGPGAASDHALAAARAALAIRGALPDATVLVVAARRFVGGGEAGGAPGGVLPEPSPGEGVVVDDTIAMLLGERFVLRPAARGHSLDGYAPWPVRTLLGRRAPFVGRDAELGALEAAFDGCARERRPRAVVVVGPAGAGKSRLRETFFERLRARGREHAVWVGRGDPVRAGSAFAMIAQALAHGVGAVDQEPPAGRRARLEAFVRARVDPGEATRVADFLGEVIGAPGEAPSVQLRAARRDAVLLADHVRRAWQEVVAAEAERHPLVLALDDLHWGDASTVRLVDAALRSTRAPLFVLALARPEVDDAFPGLWEERAATRLALGELSGAAAASLVRQGLGGGVDASVVARVVARGEGNPFFLEELVRAVAAGRGDDLPATVLAMLQTRLDALDEAPRRVLRAASVFGRSFWTGGVVELLGGASDDPDVDASIVSLAAGELIARPPVARFAGESEWIFRHALVRDAAYACLTEADRALGHRLAAAWLVEMGEGDARVLADHAERGGDVASAVLWSRRAAEQALDAGDIPAAVQWAQRARELEPEPEVVGELLALEAEAHLWTGTTTEAERCGVEAMALLAPGSPGFCRAAGAAARAAGRLGHLPALRGAARALVDAAPAPPDPPWIRAAARALVGLMSWEELDLATALFERIQAAEPSSSADLEVRRDVLEARWWMIGGAEDPEASIHLGAQIAALSDDLGDLRAAAVTRLTLANELNQVGDLDEAERVLGIALADVERLGVAFLRGVALHPLGLTLALGGRVAEGAAAEREAIVLLQACGEPRIEAGAWAFLARILLLAGDGEGARAAVEAASSLPQGAETRACGLAVRAAAELLGGRPAAALALADEAEREFSSVSRPGDASSLVMRVVVEARHAAGDPRAPATARAARERLRAAAARISDPSRRCRFEALPDNARVLELARALGVD